MRYVELYWLNAIPDAFILSENVGGTIVDTLYRAPMSSGYVYEIPDVLFETMMVQRFETRHMAYFYLEKNFKRTCKVGKIELT